MKKKILIVVANYYGKIALDLLSGAELTLKAYKAPVMNTITVPGVFEIPVVIAQNIDTYDAFIALGCVIKGKTPHFEFISKAVTSALMNLSITHKKPIGNGIITCLNKKQGLERSKLKGKGILKNKGREAAYAVWKLFHAFDI